MITTDSREWVKDKYFVIDVIFTLLVTFLIFLLI